MVSVTGSDGDRALIKARGLDKTYHRGSEDIHVLRGLNLDVGRGEFVAFMGPSGSGKTTLLNLLGGLDRPTAGSVRIDGTDLAALSANQLAAWRARHVGFVFQVHNLVPVLSAFRNVELPLLLTTLSRSARRRRVEAALRIVGLTDRMRHYPRQLSGGQEQRVAIARAIVADPALLLCDEPTGDLDRTAADAVLDLLSALVADHGTTVLMVTHDPRAAERATAVVHLEKGALVGQTRPAQPAPAGGLS
jgi:putative ABC transport system ATP-binding protein